MDKNSKFHKDIKLDTFPKLNILMDLSYLKKFEGTISEYATQVKRRKEDPEIREVFKVLKKEGILIPTSKKYSFQLYKLDIRPLCKLIEQQEFIKKIRKYLDYIH